MIENDLLYSKEKANYPNNQDRRVHYSTTLADITETSTIELISFRNSLKLNMYTESRKNISATLEKLTFQQKLI